MTNVTTTSADGVRKRVYELRYKLVGAGIIPPVANYIFNLMINIVDHLDMGQKPVIDTMTVYDVAVGCAFAVVGVCVSSDGDVERELSLLSVSLILLIIGGYAFHIFYGWPLGLIVPTNDFICFSALMWAIWRAG